MASDEATKARPCVLARARTAGDNAPSLVALSPRSHEGARDGRILFIYPNNARGARWKKDFERAPRAEATRQERLSVGDWQEEKAASERFAG